MIWQFVRRDAAWRYTPTFAATLGVASLFYKPAHQSSMLVALAAPVFMVLFMWSAPHRRATLFEAALPVSGRTLFLARYLALLSLTWLPAGAMALALALRGYGDVSAGLLAVALSLSLAVTAILSIRPQGFAAPAWLSFVAPIAVGLGLAPLLSMEKPLLLAGPLAIVTAVWAAIAWRCVPEGFQTPVFHRARRRGSAEPTVAWWPLISSLATWQQVMFVSVGLIFVTTGDWVFGPLYMMIAYSQTRMVGRWTMALPISRRAIVTISALPMLLALVAGTEIGIQARIAGAWENVVQLGDRNDFRATGALNVSVSRAFWRISPDGRVPEVHASWGETARPPATRLLLWTFYNPYYVARENSLQFQDWQFARATSDIYGRAMLPRELALMKPKPRPVTLEPRMQVLTLGAVVTLALFWIWLVEAGTWHPLMRLSKWWRNGLTGGLVLLPLAGLMYLNFFVSGNSGFVVALLQAVLLSVSRGLPTNMTAVVVATVVACLAMWWAATKQAEVSEIPQRVQDTQTMFDRIR